jgi:hypothetical protein
MPPSELTANSLGHPSVIAATFACRMSAAWDLHQAQCLTGHSPVYGSDAYERSRHPPSPFTSPDGANVVHDVLRIIE